MKTCCMCGFQSVSLVGTDLMSMDGLDNIYACRGKCIKRLNRVKERVIADFLMNEFLNHKNEAERTENDLD